MSKECQSIHEAVRSLQRHTFYSSTLKHPSNGLYILFEKNEEGHGGDRIVRVGTHTGNNQLQSRIKQHFLNENKDRSIFRKNIGRALLAKDNDCFLNFWNLDLTTRKAKDQYSQEIDFDYQHLVENRVSEYIQNKFSFSVFEVDDKTKRLDIESKIISTVSLCDCCGSTSNWLGNHSPKKKIVDSGLWLVNELYKTPFDESNIDDFLNLISNS
jgi:hypothetical protein